MMRNEIDEPAIKGIHEYISTHRGLDSDLVFSQVGPACAGEAHWTAVKTILKHLRRTQVMFLVYSSGELVLVGYSDVSFQSHVDDAKSQSSFVCKLNSGVVAWKSSKQDTTTDSTIEAEYIVASGAAKELHKRRSRDLITNPSTFLDATISYERWWAEGVVIWKPVRFDRYDLSSSAPIVWDDWLLSHSSLRNLPSRGNKFSKFGVVLHASVPLKVIPLWDSDTICGFFSLRPFEGDYRVENVGSIKLQGHHERHGAVGGTVCGERSRGVLKGTSRMKCSKEQEVGLVLRDTKEKVLGTAYTAILCACVDEDVKWVAGHTSKMFQS
ncbi:hypothetical protein Sango_2741000 [Sesamum angolense]|uniref:Uncharacterized protein n=1 Tax=Sesamum angolense TaxID=2727404 RepID=A0AAE1T9X5_9LAMI|nr:hypothetical protein Sango_2741000 [Sesamum angolense]